MKRLYLLQILFTFFAFTCSGQVLLTDSHPKYLDKFDFRADSILDWRIYYSRGNTENKANKNAAVFAVSGNRQKLSDIGIFSFIEEIFRDLKVAKIAEKKLQNDFTHYNGNPETISLRWRFNGDNEFYRIAIVLTEEKNKLETLRDFVEISISVYANEPTIYLVKKDEVKKLVGIFNQFALKDWGDNYEKRP